MQDRYGLIIAAGALVLFTQVGCYERVVSERPFAGMAATRTTAAPDYSNAQSDFNKQMQSNHNKPFDPIGDWIIKPIGGAAKGIGDAFSGGGDEPAPAKPTHQPPARPATSPSDASPPAPPPKKGSSPFDSPP